MITFGFAGMILLGALLLMLPCASRTGLGLPFFDALFTATSATCVTGLVLFDTWTQFSPFGQAVLLILIQIGGLGFLTVGILIPLVIGRRIGLKERELLSEAVGVSQIGGVVRLVRRLLIGTALLEGAGAALLACRFVPLFGWKRGLWLSVFHSVSAFCNAGFDLTGVRASGTSLIGFANDPLVLLTVAALIVLGGVGFVVWDDLVETKFRLKACKLHTRAVLRVTAILLVAGTLFFLLSERHGLFAGMNASERLLSAFFQSVTPRTAGFNALDTASLSEAGQLFTMLLMFIGAAPGGTGGGVKLTTIAVICAAGAAQLRGEEETALYHFRISAQTQRRAFCTAAVYLSLMLLGVFVLSLEGQTLGAAAFECFSAIGTVGLSTGITASLRPLSRLAIILLMFTGRIGSLAVFLAAAPSGVSKRLKDPAGKIIVG